jgi:hypothetical protein
MIYSSIPDALSVPHAVNYMNHLGYPDYFIPFIGYAKLAGIGAILIPGFPRLKEWAYAGITFDLTGATYSIISVDGLDLSITYMLIPFTLLILSYTFYHKKLKENK